MTKRSATPEDASEEEGAADSSNESVGLSQRIAPFVDMLRRSAAEGKEVVW